MSSMRGLFGSSAPASMAAVMARLAVMLVAVCFAGVGFVAISTANAWAGEYHVYSCRMPNGEVAPADGWTGSATGVSVYAEDKCAKGGALVAALGDGVNHPVGSDTATWTFSPPAGESLGKASIWRAGDAEGGAVANATYEFWLSGPTQPEAFDSCVYVSSCMKAVGEPEEPLSVSNMMLVPGANLGEHLYVNASCGGLQTYKCPSGKGDPNGYAAVVYLYAADFVLSQSSQPTVSSVEGELATAPVLSGTADLAFHASDSGSGVYQAVFTVDGSQVGRTLLDSSSSCHDVGQTSDGLPAFLYLQPCAPSLNADLQFDTTTLSDGIHHFVVSVTNAAGDSTVVLDRKIAVSNHPPAPSAPETPLTPEAPGTPSTPTSPSPQLPSPGQGPSSTATHEQPSLSSPISQSSEDNGTAASLIATLQVHWDATAHASFVGAPLRPRIVSGRLFSAGGSPLSGATVQVLSTPAFQGAHTRLFASLRTASNGSFHLHLPASLPSTHLTFAYSSHPSQPVPTVTASLSLVVPARLSLRVSPRVSHIGGTIAFSGTLFGAPLPVGGKQLVLEARAPHGPWRQFHVLSTGASGRFRALYRFRLAGPIDYQFRAVSSHEADFPYTTGASPVVLVHER
jgi:hypothetical protein